MWKVKHIVKSWWYCEIVKKSMLINLLVFLNFLLLRLMTL